MRNERAATPPVTRRIDALRLTPDLSVGDGLQEMLAGAIGALHRHGSAARHPDPESVHRFRVGLRRLRSILSAFAEALPERERRALGDRLRAVAQRWGRAREWDVFLAETLARLRQALPQEKALIELEEVAQAARRRALPPGDTLRDSAAAIAAAIEDSPWLRRPTTTAAEIWETPLRDFAAALLSQRHRRLRKRVKRADATDLSTFHQLRIRVKKLRYPAELLKSLFDEEGAADYLDRLVDLQNLLGSLNDALVARTLLAEIDAPPPARHLVTGWTAHEIEVSHHRFRRIGRRFRRAAPFWEG
jgi:triphosphatase